MATILLKLRYIRCVLKTINQRDYFVVVDIIPGLSTNK